MVAAIRRLDRRDWCVASVAQTHYSATCTSERAHRTGCSDPWFTSRRFARLAGDPGTLSRPARRLCIRTTLATPSRRSVHANVGRGTTPLQLARSHASSSRFPPRPSAALRPSSRRNGWYNHPVTISFERQLLLRDRLVHVARHVRRTRLRIGEPEWALASTTPARPSPRTSPFAYDATPPAITAAALAQPGPQRLVQPPRDVRLRGHGSTSGIAGCSTVTYSGPASRSATVAGTCSDRAGNVPLKMVPLRYDAAGPSISVSPTPPTAASR